MLVRLASGDALRHAVQPEHDERRRNDRDPALLERRCLLPVVDPPADVEGIEEPGLASVSSTSTVSGAGSAAFASASSSVSIAAIVS